jgi:hypothetical protein
MFKKSSEPSEQSGGFLFLLTFQEKRISISPNFPNFPFFLETFCKSLNPNFPLIFKNISENNHSFLLESFQIITISKLSKLSKQNKSHLSKK